jgi:hypothetical protein
MKIRRNKRNKRNKRNRKNKRITKRKIILKIKFKISCENEKNKIKMLTI